MSFIQELDLILFGYLFMYDDMGTPHFTNIAVGTDCQPPV